MLRTVALSTLSAYPGFHQGEKTKDDTIGELFVHNYSLKFTYSPLKVKEHRVQHKYNFAYEIVKVVRMSSQKITINVVRRTCLISRTGFYLRVTDDSIEGSQNHAGDVYSKLNFVG